MKAVITTPTRAHIEASPEELEKLRKLLTFSNSSIAFQFSKVKKNRWWKEKDPVGWKAAKDNLEAQLKTTLLFDDAEGLYIRSGSIPYLVKDFPELGDAKRLYQLPAPKPVPWVHMLPFDLHGYQKDSVDGLIAEGHANVQLTTSAGKSAIIATVARNLGRKTVVATPSASIFNEMLKLFEHHFGKGMVGALGDGKRRLGKPFTIAISNSLRNLEPGTPEYEEFRSAEVLLVDESHLWGADSLDTLCHGLFENVPYRMFFSGTQVRGDGTEVLLHSIIGKNVCTLSTAEARKAGFICDHVFKIVKVGTTNPGYDNDDPLKMKRKHFLENQNIAQFAAKLANTMFEARGQQTLILVEEIHQIARVAKLLTVPYAYAHGNTTKKDELADMGLEKSDPDQAVEDFNRGKVKVLIGTSCIATGTNIFPVHHCVNWVGGSSEIKTKQGAVGRSVRKLKGSRFEALHVPKDFATIWDFDVLGVPAPTKKDGTPGMSDMDRQLADRIDYYGASGSTITRIG